MADAALELEGAIPEMPDMSMEGTVKLHSEERLLRASTRQCYTVLI